jgi:GAF domain-containing protein
MTDETWSEAVSLADDPTVRDLLQEVCSITNMGFAAVARVTEDRWIVCQVVDRIDFGLEPGGELAIKSTICNEIRESGQAVVIDHVGGSDEWRSHPVPMLYGFESYISLPVVLDDGTFFGTLCAIDPEPRKLESRQFVTVMQDFAARIARVVQGKRNAIPQA